MTAPPVASAVLHLTVNGEPREIAAGTTVAGLLQSLAIL